MNNIIHIHILVKLTFLFVLAVLLGRLSLYGVGILFILLLIVAMVFSRASFIKLLNKIRFLLLILLLIYAFTTPGEYVFHDNLALSLTYEGITSGIRQAMTIVSMLALLSIILATTKRDAFIGGIYQLANFFTRKHSDAERFAVRVWLTMFYVEQANVMPNKLSFDQVFHLLNKADFTEGNQLENVILKVESYSLSDWLLSILFLIVLILTVIN